MKISKYPPYSPCPCGSSKSAKFCCQKGNGWNKSARFNGQLIPVTNFAHKKCYLSGTNNCSSKISREHPITAGVLLELAPDENINISGLAWQQPLSYDIITIKSLASNILCTRHNSWLSALDDEGISLFTGLSKIVRSSKDAVKQNMHAITVLSGPDVEKWMLKTILSLHFSKFLKDTSVPDNSIDILIGIVPWPEKWGMYFEQKVGHIVKTATRFTVQLLHKNGSKLIKAVRFILCGFSFIFLMDSEVHASGLGYFRPTKFIVDSVPNDRYVYLSWPWGQVAYDVTLVPN